MQLKVPIFFTLGATPGWADERAGFVNELRTLQAWSQRYPETRVSVTHGFPWRAFLDGGRRRFELTDEMWDPFKDCGIHMEVSFPVRVGDIFDYPYRQCLPVLDAMVEHIGADRLMWGTDWPLVEAHCGYAKALAIVRDEMKFLSEEDKSWMLSKTIERVWPFS